ncbi:MAG: hypothetical protein NZ762_04135 [Dehalococcoidia bacterium]|nr:hypothetical protein [Dehalococcoidia bacterium]
MDTSPECSVYPALSKIEYDGEAGEETMLLDTPSITRVDGAPGGRHYRVEGYDELFPSVTNVLDVINKPALVPWARNMALESVETALKKRSGTREAITPEWISQVISEARRRPEQVRDQAADFGTQAHVAIDQIVQGLEPQIPPEMELVVNNFTEWRRDANLDLHLTETMVFSDKYRYAGAMDAIAYRDGSLVALDWKTSNGLYPEYALQVAAYANALAEMTGKPVTEAWTVRFGKTTPEFEARQVIDLEKSFIAFRAALYLWRAIKGELLHPPA